jgi:hypothetical protein
MTLRCAVLLFSLLISPACASLQSARGLQVLPLSGQSPDRQAADVAACDDEAWKAVASTPAMPPESVTPTRVVTAIAGAVAIGTGVALAAGSPFGWALGHLTAPLGGQAILEALPSGSPPDGSPDVTRMPAYVATYRRCLEQRAYRLP